MMYIHNIQPDVFKIYENSGLYSICVPNISQVIFSSYFISVRYFQMKLFKLKEGLYIHIFYQQQKRSKSKSKSKESP